MPLAAGLPFEIRGSGPPVVLVPGLVLSRWFWRPIWRRLPGWALHSVDMPRFGPGATVAQAADRLAAWHAAMGLPPCPWVGHSLGGQICLRLAAVHPGIVTRLALVAPSLPTSYTGYRISQLAWDLLLEPPALWWQILRGLAVRGLADPLRSIAAARSDPGFWALPRRIRVPTTVIYGQNDVYIPARRLPALAAAIPAARRQVIPRAHHALVHGHAAPLAAALERFLTESRQRVAASG